MTARLREVLFDPRFLAWTVIWSVVALVAFGLASAIIPNPVFGREIPPEPFAIWIWVGSAPLMGLVAATYTWRPPPGRLAILPVTDEPTPAPRRDGTALGTVASFGAFIAIGCPVCNKAALLLLGTSGAMSVFAPIQPFIGVASLALLAGTVIWRMRLTLRGGACAV
jgi:hypothetical protein